MIGQKIRALRKRQALSQAELAKVIGIHQSDLSRIEKGEYRVSLDLLFKILQVFEMTTAEFFGELVDERITHKEKAFLDIFKRLSPEARKEVIDFLKFKLAQEEHDESF